MNGRTCIEYIIQVIAHFNMLLWLSEANRN